MKKLLLSIVLAVGIMNVYGTTYYWVGSSGASWGDGASWSTDNTNRTAGSGNAWPGYNSNAGADLAIFDGKGLSNAAYTDMSVALGAATTITSMTVSSGGTITVAASGAFTLIMASSLSFSNSTKLSATPSGNGYGFTLGNGNAFTLDQTSSCYFDGNANAYFTFNTSSPLTVYFNPAASTAYGALVPTKGIITLGSNVQTTRLNYGGNASNYTQGLVLNGTTLTLSGGNSFVFNTTTGNKGIDASIAGSKVIIASTSATLLTAAATTSLFDQSNGKAVNYLEFNKSGSTFTLPQSLKITNLVLTAGTITNSSTYNITLSDGGTIRRDQGTLQIPPIFGSSVNLVYTNSSASTVTPANEMPSTATILNNLNINATGTNKSVTLAAPTTVNGTLTINASNILDCSTFQLTAGTSFAVLNSGTIKTSNTGSTPIPTGYTYGGTTQFALTTGGQTIPANNYSNLTVSSTSGTTTLASSGTIGVAGTFSVGSGATYTVTGSTVNFNGTGQTIPAFTFYNLTLGNSSGTQTAGGALTVNGTLTTTAGGTLNMSTNLLSGTLSSISNSGTIKTSVVTTTSATPIPAGKTWGGTIEYSATTGAQTVVAGTYNNLTLDNTSATNTAGGALTVNGTLTTTASGTLDMATYDLGATSITNGGTIKSSSTSSSPISSGLTIAGTVQFALTTGGQTIPANNYNNLTISSTSGTTTLAGSGTIGVAGSFSVGSGATYTVTGSTVNFNGTGQTIPAFTFNNLTLGNSSGTQTAGGALTVNGNLTTTAGGTLNMATNILSGTLSSISNSGTIKTSVLTTTSTTPIPASKTWGGTIEYGATTGAQTVVAGTYNNLTLDNTSATNTAGGAITVNGTLTTTVGGTLDMASNDLGVSSITNGGTIKTSSISSTPISSGKTIAGTVQFAVLGGGQTIPAGTYTNLTFSNTSGTNTASGAITSTGTLITTSGGTLDMSTYDLGVSSITNGGTIKTSSTSSTPISSGKTIAGTVQFAVTSGGQTIPSGTYTNLTLLNASGTNTASGAITSSGTLTTTSGGTLDMSTYTLGVSTITNGGTITTNSTSNTPLTSGKTWGGTVQFAKTDGGQTIPIGTYGILTLSNNSGTNTSSGGAVNATTLNTSAGGTWDMGSTGTLGGTLSTITLNGTLKTQDTASPIPNNKVYGGTIEFNGTSPQVWTASSTTHVNNLIINLSSG